MKSLHVSVLTSAVGIALFGAAVSADLSAAGAISAQVGAVAMAQSPVGRYIVTFGEPGVVAYKGDVAGLQRTAPETNLVAANSSRKLDAKSSAAQAYEQHLAEQRAVHVRAIEQTLGRDLTVRYVYSITRNAISAEMNAGEAAAIAQVPGILSVEPVQVLQPDTFRGPTFIGANTIWDGSGVPSYDAPSRGQGIRVGVIDTGANSAHPSFANDPMCGFSATKPKLVAHDCIGSSGCTGPTPEADAGNGHGVHTSSTAAGNRIDNTATPAPLLPDGVSMSGVAPCAQVYSYKVCTTSGCANDAITAAIQNAVADQVDVINYSLGPGCGGGNPWNDSLDFLAAEAADVFVAASAGNTRAECPVPTGRVANNGPWMLTVAASSQDQLMSPQISATGPGTPPAAAQDIALVPGSTTLTPAQTVDLDSYPLRTFPVGIQGCSVSGESPFPANYFSGAIAIMQRGNCSFTEKISNAYNAGARTVLIANNAVGSVIMNTTAAPADAAAFSMLQAPGEALIDFVNANLGPLPAPDSVFVDGFELRGGATGNYRRAAIGQTQGDVLADFSLRGPTLVPYDNLTKPDITGPGVAIFAALDEASGSYGLMSGTSMSSPHLAGSAALVRAVQPAWSPMEVKSALQTTATLTGFKENGVTPWDADDVGSGRVDLSKATRAGLTLDESPENFAAANPDGGTLAVKELNLASLRDTGCGTTCTWTRTFKNRLNESGTWTLSGVDPAGYSLSFDPTTFTLAPGDTQVVTVTAATQVGTPTNAMKFGRVDLTESSGQAPVEHLTVAVKGQLPVAWIAPANLSSTQATNTATAQSLTIANLGGGALAWTYNGASIVNGTMWDQPKDSNGGLVSSYSIADNGGGFIAADFLIFGAAPSPVRKLTIFGFDNADKLALQPRITWRIYGDAGGKPSGNPDTGIGAAPVWTLDLAPTDAGVSITGTGDITLDLAAAGQTLNLPAGTYWLTVFPSYSTTFGGTGAARWLWSQGTQKSGPALMTGNRYGVPDWTSLPALGVAWSDVAFSIEGDVQCGAPWLGVSPLSASVVPGMPWTVTARFDSTGMPVGTYYATACFATNDPAKPMLTVPVMMTVRP